MEFLDCLLFFTVSLRYRPFLWNTNFVSPTGTVDATSCKHTITICYDYYSEFINGNIRKNINNNILKLINKS